MKKSNRMLEQAFKELDKPVIRKEVVRLSFEIFFNVYFHEYIKYPFAAMHKEIFEVCQNSDIQLVLVMAFRGSGKSTLISTAYPLWALLGIQQKKYIVLVAKTKPQARQILKNIRTELEQNVSLKSDLGPFQEESDEWGSDTLVFTQHKARITVVSLEQSLKGLRHREHRPDLIILDDIEDSDSVKTKEGRNKTYEKYKQDILPLGDKGTKIIHVGNFLHDEALIPRISRESPEKENTKAVLKYPIVSEEGVSTWLGKFPSGESIESERLKISDEKAWSLEYLLKTSSSYEQIITRDMIQSYETIPYGKYRSVIVGVDLAISQKESADYTAMVPILVQKEEEVYKVYVLKHIVHARFTFLETNEAIINLNQILRASYDCDVAFVVESVGYQSALTENVRTLSKVQLRVENKNVSLDKEARLRVVSPMFANKKIFFSEHDTSDLITELIGFGNERHDDLVDALTLGISYAYEKILARPTVAIA